MHIDWWTLALQAINVLVLVWLLARFLYRPVMDAITARQAMADKLLADARTARDAAAAAEAALKARTEAEAADAGQRRAEMRASIETERAHLFEQAKAQADALAKQAAAAAEAERVRMQAELEEKAGTLAGAMAGRLLQRLPVAPVIDAMFAVLLDRVRALSEDQRRALGSEAPLTVVTPATLPAEARKRYAEELAAALPGMAMPDFAVDPALIGGFELRGAHMLVRNSWRADLDDLVGGLKEDAHARIG